MMFLLRRFKTTIISALAGVLFIVLTVARARRNQIEELEDTVNHYKVKEEADAVRSEPVARVKSGVLARM